VKDRTSVTQVALWGLSNIGWLVGFVLFCFVLFFFGRGGFLVHRCGTDTYAGFFFFFFPKFCDIMFFCKYFPKISMLALKPSGDRLAL
jgi:hypothetical protein